MIATFRIKAGELNKRGEVFTQESLKQLDQQLPGKAVSKDGSRVGKIIETVLRNDSIFASVKFRGGVDIFKWKELDLL